MAFLEHKEQRVQDVLSVGNNKMCRKCFSAYDRYSKLHDIIQDNLRKAAYVLGIANISASPIEYPLPKRPRLGSTTSENQERQQCSHDGDISVHI